MPKHPSPLFIHIFYERLTLSLLRALPSTLHPSSDSGHDALIGKEFVSDEVKRFLDDPRLGAPIRRRARVASEPVSYDQIVDTHRLSVETIERARRSSGAANHAPRDASGAVPHLQGGPVAAGRAERGQALKRRMIRGSADFVALQQRKSKMARGHFVVHSRLGRWIHRSCLFKHMRVELPCR